MAHNPLIINHLRRSDPVRRGRREYAIVRPLVAPDIAHLQAIEDVNGNRLDLSYVDGRLARVVDTLGRAIDYAYYPEADPNPGRRNRLATVTDFTGRRLSYDYDADGNLVEAIGPAVAGTVTGNDFPAGKRETYTYTSGFADRRLNHNLTSVTRGNEHDARFGLPADGTPALRWTYTASDRIATHTVGATNGPGAVGGVVRYEYDANPAPPPDFNAALEDEAAFKTTETDRNGNVRVYWHNDFGALVRFEHFTRGLRPGDPAKYVTRYKVNADNRNTLVTHSEGNQERFVFDAGNPDVRQRANALSWTRIPDAARGGAQPEIERRMVYDPFYNQMCLLIDPRGVDPAYTPPNGGAASPMRYKTSFVFDYQEGPDAATHRQRLADHFAVPLAAVDALIALNEAQVEAALCARGHVSAFDIRLDRSRPGA